MYNYCYATIARRKMRCLVTAGKYVNNTRAIARQLFGKRVPVAADTQQRPSYCWTITMETIFFMWFVPKCYKRVSRIPELKLWAVLLSEVTWSSWLVSESAYEEKTRRLVWNGREPGTQLIELSVDKVLHGRLWQKDLSAENWYISTILKSVCQETASGRCNTLRTLVCVCHWYMQCSSEWCIQVASNPVYTPSIVSHTPLSRNNN
jgi:hypothetical protein